MKFRSKAVMGLIWMIASAWVAVTPLYLDWPFRTALFPLIIGSAVLVMSATETILCFFGKEASSADTHAVESGLRETADNALTSKRTFQAFGWIIGFVALIVLLGFNIAIPLFVLFFLKLQGKEGWGLSLVLAGLAWGFFYGLFIRILHTPFPEGLLFRGFNI